MKIRITYKKSTLITCALIGAKSVVYSQGEAFGRMTTSASCVGKDRMIILLSATI